MKNKRKYQVAEMDICTADENRNKKRFQEAKQRIADLKRKDPQKYLSMRKKMLLRALKTGKRNPLFD